MAHLILPALPSIFLAAMAVLSLFTAEKPLSPLWARIRFWSKTTSTVSYETRNADCLEQLSRKAAIEGADGILISITGDTAGFYNDVEITVTPRGLTMPDAAETSDGFHLFDVWTEKPGIRLLRNEHDGMCAVVVDNLCWCNDSTQSVDPTVSTSNEPGHITAKYCEDRTSIYWSGKILPRFIRFKTASIWHTMATRPPLRLAALSVVFKFESAVNLTVVDEVISRSLSLRGRQDNALFYSLSFSESPDKFRKKLFFDNQSTDSRTVVIKHLFGDNDQSSVTDTGTILLKGWIGLSNGAVGLYVLNWIHNTSVATAFLFLALAPLASELLTKERVWDRSAAIGRLSTGLYYGLLVLFIYVSSVGITALSLKGTYYNVKDAFWFVLSGMGLLMTLFAWHLFMIVGGRIWNFCCDDCGNLFWMRRRALMHPDNGRALCRVCQKKYFSEQLASDISSGGSPKDSITLPLTNT